MAPDAAIQPHAQPRRIAVPLAPHPYEVVIGPGALADLGRLIREPLGEAPTRAMLVEDGGVPAGIRDQAAAALEDARFRIERTAIAPSEAAKSVRTWADILTQLAEARLERADPVVALGGGILADVAGFAAAAYRRGVPVIQCPTTLLAMVDASVGGKTGINLKLAGGALVKNMAGAFHQPRLVLSDIDTLSTLDERTLRCGLAECVKHGLIAGGFDDPGLLAWTESSTDALRARDPGILTDLVERNVGVKARVVCADERETDHAGGRALLNLGHTFAHAIETIDGLSPTSEPADAPLQHGEAVALGLVAACHAAAELGEPDAEALTARVRALLERLGLPTRVAGLPATDELFQRTGHDKKTEGERMRLIVPSGVGIARVVANPPKQVVAAGFEAIRT